MSKGPNYRRASRRYQDNGLRPTVPPHRKPPRHRPKAKLCVPCAERRPARPPCRTARLAQEAIELASGRPRRLTEAERTRLPEVLSWDEHLALGATGHSEQWVVEYATLGEDSYWDEHACSYCTREKWVEELVEERFRRDMGASGVEYRLRRVRYQ